MKYQMAALLAVAMLTLIGFSNGVEAAEKLFSRDMILKQSSTMLSKVLCDESSHYSKCFPHVKKAECLAAVKQNVNLCIGKIKNIYAKTLTRKQTQQMGFKVGVCNRTLFKKNYSRNPELEQFCKGNIGLERSRKNGERILKGEK